MTTPRPTFDEYPQWAEATLGVRFGREQQNLYDACLRGAREKATSILQPLAEAIESTISRKYKETTGSDLLMTPVDNEVLRLALKPFSSAVDKSYRHNVNWNDAWPSQPKDDWVTPDNWITRFNDNIRTTLVCKYLDGPKFLAEQISAWAASERIRCDFYSQQKDVGYYAYHVYLYPVVQVLDKSWNDREAEVSIELQLSTQLQEVMRALTHRQYEKDRIGTSQVDEAWQWAHTSEVFRSRYISHTLHLLEGIILELRDSKRGA